MAIGMTTLVETRNFQVIKYRHGTEITNRLTGKSVYLQPGDDEWAFLGPLEQLEEEHGSLDNCHMLVDHICDAYDTVSE